MTVNLVDDKQDKPSNQYEGELGDDKQDKPSD